MGFSRKENLNTNTSTSNPNLSCSANIHNSSYVYHGPQVHTVRESITSSTNATFLVYQYPKNSVLVKQAVLPATIESAQRFRYSSLA
ncbi:hypothetical protein BRARA_A01946 [Brassica rapa]|uniref:Uncharacterized protein n=2 Tax=Brassica TaxID=3705 RepID=A0A398AQL8_BRACM|nr:hypothetical protein BRARA_A01946 [Brassica rapa]CAF2150906.1 unnamed protein product [Brassica napus]CAG7888103.1 unnamed protein product [Brassica rapa]VDC75562.1 unnamed protein product [Brassica rapa]